MVDQESVRPLAKSAAAKAKHTPAPGYEKVALAITGDDPPAWLVKFLKMWGPCLAVDRGVAAVQTPTKPHQRQNLEGVRAGAARILSALDDGETRGFLDAASPGTIPDRLAICRLMSDLVRRAEEGVSWLVKGGGNKHAGRSRAVPLLRIMPMIMIMHDFRQIQTSQLPFLRLYNRLRFKLGSGRFAPPLPGD